MDLKRQVKVKTGVVKRLRKELAMYEQEKVQNEKRVDEMRANGADTYDIRQAVSERGSRDPLLLFSGGHALVARSSWPAPGPGSGHSPGPELDRTAPRHAALDWTGLD